VFALFFNFYEILKAGELQLIKAFRSFQKSVISFFLRGRRSHEMPPWLDRNSIKILFGYLDGIQTRRGESKAMNLPFLFAGSLIFRDFDLAATAKMH